MLLSSVNAANAAEDSRGHKLPTPLPTQAHGCDNSHGNPHCPTAIVVVPTATPRVVPTDPAPPTLTPVIQPTGTPVIAPTYPAPPTLTPVVQPTTKPGEVTPVPPIWEVNDGCSSTCVTVKAVTNKGVVPTFKVMTFTVNVKTAVLSFSNCDGVFGTLKNIVSFETVAATQ